MRNLKKTLFLVVTTMFLPRLFDANQNYLGWRIDGAHLFLTGGVSSIAPEVIALQQCRITVSGHVGPLGAMCTCNTYTPLASLFSTMNNPHWRSHAPSELYDIELYRGRITTPAVYSDVILHDSEPNFSLYQSVNNDIVLISQRLRATLGPRISCVNNAVNSSVTSSTPPIIASADLSSELESGFGTGPLDASQRHFGEGEASTAQAGRVETALPKASHGRAIFEDNKTTGGSPLVLDIRDYGAYATFSSTTCTTVKGSPIVTIASAANFQNGEYATCYAAGPAATVSTPSAPTITPSVHSGGMSATKYNGSTSYSYCIVAEDKYNGRTACSLAGSTSTGIAALGQNAFTVMAITRSNQAVTLTTRSEHNLVPGQMFWLGGATDTTYNGTWVAIAPTGGNTVTFQSGWDTRNGASSSSGVSNAYVTGWWMNRVSWKHATDSFRHHIYGPNCPTTCNWLGQSVLDYWDDYGSTMELNQSRPPYIPVTAPLTTANEHFTFRITSGGGTRTLTASNNAAASVSGNGIVSDIGPALVAAAAASKVGSYGFSDVLIPHIANSQWYVNSYTDICSTNTPALVLNATQLTLNQPLCAIEIRGEGENAAPQFAFGTYSNIYGIGYPQLYASGTYALKLSNLNITNSSLNGGLSLWAINPINHRYFNTYWMSSIGGRTDFMGQNAIFQTSGSGGCGFNNQFERTVIASNEPYNSKYGTVSSPVPTWVFTGSTHYGTNLPGGMTFKDGWFLWRGSIDLDGVYGSGGGSIDLEDFWAQNGVSPLVQNSGIASGLQGAILKNITVADYPTPVFASYGPTARVLLYNVSGGSLFENVLQGQPINDVIATGSSATTLGTNSNNQNSTGTSITSTSWGQSANIGVLQLNENVDLGNNYAIFSGGNARPPAPICSVATAGPPYTPAGTVYFWYAPVWQNGAVGTLSAASASSCTANGSSQQITVTIPTAIAGALGYMFYSSPTSVTAQYQLGQGNCALPATTSTTFIYETFCINTPPASTGFGPAGLQNGNVYAQSLVFGPSVAPEGVASSTKFYMDGISNWPSFKPNGNTAYVIPGITGSIINGHNLCANGTTGAYVDCLTTRTIASGTSVLGTDAIAARTCATVVTSPAVGLAPADAIFYSFNAAPSGAYTAGLFIQSYVTPGKVNFLVCNLTPNSLTPPPATLNWRVIR